MNSLSWTTGVLLSQLALHPGTPLPVVEHILRYAVTALHHDPSSTNPYVTNPYVTVLAAALTRPDVSDEDADHALDMAPAAVLHALISSSPRLSSHRLLHVLHRQEAPVSTWVRVLAARADLDAADPTLGQAAIDLGGSTLLSHVATTYPHMPTRRAAIVALATSTVQRPDATEMRALALALHHHPDLRTALTGQALPPAVRTLLAAPTPVTPEEGTRAWFATRSFPDVLAYTSAGVDAWTGAVTAAVDPYGHVARAALRAHPTDVHLAAALLARTDLPNALRRQAAHVLATAQKFTDPHQVTPLLRVADDDLTLRTSLALACTTRAALAVADVPALRTISEPLALHVLNLMARGRPTDIAGPSANALLAVACSPDVAGDTRRRAHTFLAAGCTQVPELAALTEHLCTLDQRTGRDVIAELPISLLPLAQQTGPGRQLLHTFLDDIAPTMQVEHLEVLTALTQSFTGTCGQLFDVVTTMLA